MPASPIFTFNTIWYIDDINNRELKWEQGLNDQII